MSLLDRPWAELFQDNVIIQYIEEYFSIAYVRLQIIKFPVLEFMWRAELTNNLSPYFN
jgi:hypothetical protein